ncbi:hypothetical protein [Burkholderia oklahomensis]|uniref:hypothetical protein n=1 Tax=Burkholderia oklahomensis TaxID=342113 RepID=UPI000B1BDEA2|nr:hypothetical protein [Burkholderia oklahomensis]MBI0363768.1 hypothetical protein [Burkholderia oklahomensis]
MIPLRAWPVAPSSFSVFHSTARPVDRTGSFHCHWLSSLHSDAVGAIRRADFRLPGLLDALFVSRVSVPNPPFSFGRRAKHHAGAPVRLFFRR